MNIEEPQIRNIQTVTGRPATEGPIEPAEEDRHQEHFKTDHLLINLKRRTISSGAVTMSAQGLKFLLSLISTVILARLLTPRDFGLVAMVTTITGFLRVFKDAGLSIATVQRERITHAQVSNLFWVNIAVSALGTLIVAAAAPIVARFYQNDRLISVTLLLSTTFLISGSTVQHQALLKRQMRFKALAAIEVGSMTIGVLVGVLMALGGYRYWSLVGSSLSTEIAGLLLTWSVSRWRPQLPTRRSGIGPLLSFGAHRTTGDFIMAVARGSDNLLVGRYYGAAAVGLYSRASVLLVRPLELLLGPINAVFIPALSRLQSHPERYRSTFLRVYEAIALTTFFSGALTLALARPLTLVLLGPKWEQAAAIFAGFTIAALCIPLANASVWLFTSQGRGRDMLLSQSINSCAIFVSYIIGLPFGPVGVAVTFSIFGPLIRIPVAFFLAGRRGPVKTADLWNGVWRHLPVWVFVFVVTWLTHRMVVSLSSPLQLLICLSVGALAGAAFICTFAPQRQVAIHLIESLRELGRPRLGKVIMAIVPQWITNKQNAYVFGDSHAKIFSHINAIHPFSKLYFDVTPVKGATAQGLVNPNSQTNSLQIFKNKINTINNKQSILIFLLGEVDTGFVIWYRAQKYGDSVEVQLERSLANYISFLTETQKCGFQNIFVVSAPLPTIRDNQTWGDIANLRKEVTATQLERTELTLKYNSRLQDLCDTHGIKFVNFDEELLDSTTGLIKDVFLNKDRNNHHLDADQYSAICYSWVKTLG
jgi:O-antigen/teichoic acid export membrane protein